MVDMDVMTIPSARNSVKFPAQEFRDLLSSDPMRTWVRNVETELSWIEIEGHPIPVTQNTTQFASSYVVSPYAALILYSRQEMVKIPRAFHFLLAILWPLSFLLKSMRLNQHVALNNWLLSTNLYPAVSSAGLVAKACELREQNPESFILLRSLNERTNGSLIAALKAEGFSFIPSRQVYFFDVGKDVEERHNFKMDQRLLQKSGLKVVPGRDFLPQDFTRAEELYNLLYLEKYSEYNPAFTSDYLKLCRDTGTMQFWGLLGADGVLQAVTGFFIVNGILTAPIVGYDTHKPASLGLYRQAIALTLQEARKQGLLVNLSSGASGFKRLRGGVPVTEWSAVDIRHLSWGRRVGFRILQGLLYGIALPLLKVFKL